MNEKTDLSKFDVINREKPIPLFAPFHSQEEMDEMFDSLVSRLSESDRFDLCVFVARWEQTIREGK